MPSKLLKKCHFRKLLIFIWLVAIFLTTSFLSIGIFTKFREALRGVIEIDGEPYEECEIFFMLFNQLNTDQKLSESSEVSVPFRYDEELSATVFDPRFLCNLESAIRYHPNNTVCILIHLPPQSPAIKSLSNSVYQLYEKIKKAKHPWPGDTLENNVDNEMERNIRVLSLNLDKVFEYTPLQDWWREDLRYTLSVWKSVHLSEVARLGFLWKYGGLYLDHDVLLVKPLLEESSKQSNTKERHNIHSTNTTSDELGDNFIGFQSLNISHLIPDDTSTNLAKYFYPEDNYENSNTGLGGEGIGTSVMRFKRPRHPFISKWMYSIPSNYDEDIRDSIGSTLATKLIIPFCQGDIPKSKIDVKKLLDKFCDYNLHILGPNAFYPFHWKQWECLFKETKRTKSSHDEKIEPHLPVSNEDPMMTNSTYAVHTWYDLYRRMQKVKDISSKSPYIKLSQTHCPTTYHSQMKSLS